MPNAAELFFDSIIRFYITLLKGINCIGKKRFLAPQDHVFSLHKTSF